MWNEFKKFIARGSVIDLAVGIIIGAAFKEIVDSLVNHILMPPLGLLIGRVDFSSLYIDLTGEDYASLAEAEAAGAPTINYGRFINEVVEFLIIALAVFLLIRQINRIAMRRASVPAAPTDMECPYCRFKIPIGATRCAHCTSELQAA